MERCPICRARLAGASTCPRCEANLSLARAAGTQAAQHLERALASLGEADCRQAEHHARQSLWLHRTPLAEAILGWSQACKQGSGLAFTPNR